MKAKKFTPAMRGLAALMTCLMVLSIVGTGVANTYRGALDDTLGTESYVTINDDSAARFKTDYATIEDMAAAARDIAIREGEEGTVVMKNDNGVLPLKANANAFCKAPAPQETGASERRQGPQTQTLPG